MSEKQNPILGYADSYRTMQRQGTTEVGIWSIITDLERNMAPLMGAAQSELAVLQNQLGERWTEISAFKETVERQEGELAALREELAKVTEQSEWRREMAESNCKQHDAQVVVSHGLQQRLTAAEHRNAELVNLLHRTLAVIRGEGWNELEADICAAVSPKPTESGASENKCCERFPKCVCYEGADGL